MNPESNYAWQTIAALVLPSLSLLYAIAVQLFNATYKEFHWCQLAPAISIRIAFLGVTLGIIVPKDGLDPAYSIACAVVIGLLSVVLIHRIRVIYVNGPRPKLSTDLTSRIFMVTGANTGIGKETVRQLVAAGATVIMACRNEERAKEAMEDIIQSLEAKAHALVGKGTKLDSNKDGRKELRDRLILLSIDLTDVASIRHAVQAFIAMNIPLHVLINNAGIIMGERVTNSKGWELTMAANHFGHFLLTNLLLPVLQQQQDARVIVVSSSTYVLAKKGVDLADLNCNNKKYAMFHQYYQSKLANILMGVELTRREKERTQNKDESAAVMVHMVHPGLVRTDVVRNMPWYLKYSYLIFGFILRTLQKTPEAGAYTSVYCATDESLRERSGEFFINSQAVALTQYARNPQAAKDLWKLSSMVVEADKLE